MPKSNSYIPEGLRTITPELVVTDATRTMDFLRKTFGADIQNVIPGPNGKGVAHALARIGDSALYLTDQTDFGSKRTVSNLCVYVKDVDSTFNKAIVAGAKQVQPVADQFWGDRWCVVEDPSGNYWQIATHIEDVSPEDLRQRAEAFNKTQQQRR